MKKKKMVRRVKPVRKTKRLPSGKVAFKAELERWQEVSEARGRLAQAAYDFQDGATKEVLNRIRDRLRLGATGLIELRLPDGRTERVRTDMKYTDFNIMFIATEILKDMALMDVRVANYKFPPAYCVECGMEITKQPKKKRGPK